MSKRPIATRPKTPNPESSLQTQSFFIRKKRRKINEESPEQKAADQAQQIWFNFIEATFSSFKPPDNIRQKLLETEPPENRATILTANNKELKKIFHIKKEITLLKDITELIDSGINVNLRNKHSGATALYIAAVHKINWPVVKTLILGGATMTNDDISWKLSPLTNDSLLQPIIKQLPIMQEQHILKLIKEMANANNEPEIFTTLLENNQKRLQAEKRKQAHTPPLTAEEQLPTSLTSRQNSTSSQRSTLSR